MIGTQLIKNRFFGDLLGLALLYYFFLYRFDLGLIFTDTVLTGGDASSWYQIALHLKEELLPYGRVFGWSQANYFGYDNLLHYFVFPFLLIVFFSYLIPLTIALKLVSLIGSILFPLAVYWTLRKLNYRTPIPLIGAWISVYFLFHEQWSIFGGNLLSTFAGEFSFSFAFCLFVVFVGNLHRGVECNTRLISNSLLLAAIGLSHSFVFFSAVLLPAYYLLGRNRFKHDLPYVAKLWFIAFLLMAFWVFPMLDMRAYTTQVNIVWHFYDWGLFLDGIGRATLLLLALGLVMFLFKSWRTTELGLYLYIAACAVALYFLATLIDIPDIRFFPVLLFASLCILIECLWQLYSRARFYRSPISIILLCIVVVATGKIVFHPGQQAPAWYDWNYKGFENTPAFKNGVFDDLVKELHGDPLRGRIAWEHADHGSDFGSERVFENLPMYTGRYTTEGIHYAAGFLSKTVSVLNSEYSLRPGGAEPIIPSYPDADKLRDHFELFNITELLVKSTPIERMLRQSEDFELTLLSGDYSIFKLKNYQPSFVSPLDYMPPVAEIDSTNKRAAIRNWFRRGNGISNLFIDRADLTNDDTAKHFTDTASLDAFGRLKVSSRTSIQAGKVDEEFINDRLIRFTTDAVGQPHLVKVSYSPAWQSTNGEPIFRLAPGLMLLFPTQNQVELHYTRSPMEILGLALSLLGLAVILSLRLNIDLTERILDRLLLLHFLREIDPRVLKLVLACSIAGVIVLAWQGASAKLDSLSYHYTGNTLIHKQQHEQSVSFFGQLLTDDTLRHKDNNEIPLAMLALARAHYALDQLDKAETQLLQIIDDYPAWNYADQVYQLLARISSQRQRREYALNYLDKCIEIQKVLAKPDTCAGDKESLGD